MTRMLAIFLANLAVVIALSANAVVTLATGCSIGGTCSASPSAMTWVLAVVPSLLLIVGTLWIRRSLKSAVAATPSVVAETEGKPAKIKAPKVSAAASNAEAATVEDAGRDRLSRVVASNNRSALAPLHDESVDTGTAQQLGEEATDVSDDEQPMDPPVAGQSMVDDEPVAEAEPFAPTLVPVPAFDPAASPTDNWMWLVDPARPHHLAPNSVTGFPWIAGVIDLFAAALASDPHFSDDADAQAEAAAWLEITATLPVDLPIEAIDGQAFVDWANSHIGDKGHLLTPLLSAAMSDLRAEAMAAPDLAAALPAAFRQDDGQGPTPLALAG